MTNRMVQTASLLLLLFSVARVRGATYIPISDGELARHAPVIVLGEVVDETVRSENIDGQQMPFTLTSVKVLEVLKGSIPSKELIVRLLGGEAGDVGVWVPGRPQFLPGQQTILFLAPREGHPGEYGLTEFGLSKFDVMEDGEHHRFAVRSVFPSGDDDLPEERGRGARNLESFLLALRVAGKGEPMPAVERAQPAGALMPSKRPLKIKADWVNANGREPGAACTVNGAPSFCLFRWFWDNGASADGLVSVNGTQSNLSDGSNGISAAADAVAKWTGIAPSGIRYSVAPAGGNVVVNLDVASDPGGAWSSPDDCGSSGGLVGIASWFFSLSTSFMFKGDRYNPPAIGSTQLIRIRKNICPAGYSATVFRSAVLHEMGHTLGLGHPNQAVSIHSTTSPADWQTAVMFSQVGIPPRTTPQLDDIQAIQYYYGTGLCNVDSTTLCLNGSRFRVTAATHGRARAVRRGSTQVAPATFDTALAAAVPVTSDTGYFWFSNSSDVDLVVRVIDGRATNGKFWVLYGSLSDLEYTITVTDTETKAVKTYFNPVGQLASVADKNAF